MDWASRQLLVPVAEGNTPNTTGAVGTVASTTAVPSKSPTRTNSSPVSGSAQPQTSFRRVAMRASGGNSAARSTASQG